MQLSGIQSYSAAQLRELIATLPGAEGTKFMRAAGVDIHAAEFWFHEQPLADDDLAGWRIAAASMLAQDTIREAVGQNSKPRSIVVADDAVWATLEKWLGKRPGSLIANTTGFDDTTARISFPRAAVEAASDAADLLASGATMGTLPADARRAVQLYTSTAPHEMIHAAAYDAPAKPDIAWMNAGVVSPFTEGLTEAATSGNYRRFSDRILGPNVGSLTDAERQKYGYAPVQLEPMQRVANLAASEAPATVLLRNAAAVPIGQQAQQLVRDVAPHATAAQADALVGAVINLARDRSQRNADATQSLAAFDAALGAVRAARPATT